MTPFLLEAVHQEVHMSLTGLTRLVLAEIEHVETDAGGTLILQSPLSLEPGIFDLDLRLLHLEEDVWMWSGMRG